MRVARLLGRKRLGRPTGRASQRSIQGKAAVCHVVFFAPRCAGSCARRLNAAGSRAAGWPGVGSTCSIAPRRGSRVYIDRTAQAAVTAAAYVVHVGKADASACCARARCAARASFNVWMLHSLSGACCMPQCSRRLAATFGLHSAFARLKTRDLLDVDLRQVWCVAAVRPNRSVAVQMTPALSMQQGSLLLLGSLRIWGVQVRRTTLC